ncbi:MAG: NAD+ synthase [Acidimicrobiales bacterium]
MRVAAAQINLWVGGLDSNVSAMVSVLTRARVQQCQLVVFPELAVTGYPPEDLLLRSGFVDANRRALDAVAANTGSETALIGFVDAEDGLVYNAAAICRHGQVLGIYRKQSLPNYSVFDEIRYFRPGSGQPTTFEIGSARVRVAICEDIWDPHGPLADVGADGADLVAVLNASPYRAGRLAERAEILAGLARRVRCPIVYTNLVGGQDELVFDGASMVLDRNGDLLARGAQFAEDLVICDLDVGPPPSGSPAPRPPTVQPVLGEAAEVYGALVLGTRDYVTKNGFSDATIGLSGGVDSALVAAIATDALGPTRVHGVAMPSRYSSPESLADAAELAANLGIDFRTIVIEEAHSAFEALLADSFEGRVPGLAEENVQARIRGTLLMALSNKLGWMVLATGNKSEMAVGFSTLYGDLAGGLAVIKDVPKILVYRLCHHRNSRALPGGGTSPPGFPIPDAILTKAPSAELRPDQRDDQSLPPYEVLDPILAAYVDSDTDLADLMAAGHDRATVERVIALVDRAEYKRRQSPPGLRVSAKAFGKDRRLPITNAYRH